MSRIIINNKTDVSDHQAMLLVEHVIRKGRISNDGENYCYVTIIQLDHGEYKVFARQPYKNGTQTFDIVDDASGKAGA